MDLYRVVSNYFAAGVEADSYRIRKTAPILYFMRGWTLQRTYEYCKYKGWSIEKIEISS